jgi:multiple sugar transport system permease protein
MDADLQQTTIASMRTQSGPLFGMRNQRLAQRVMVYALLLALSVVFILPFLWMVSTSLKQSEDVFTYPPSFFPTTFLWQNYPRGWTILPFNTFLINFCYRTENPFVSCRVAHRFAGKRKLTGTRLPSRWA